MTQPTFSLARAESFWREKVLPTLIDYIRIPNRSPAFDPDWKRQGSMDRAIRLACDWCHANMPPNSSVKIRELPGRTPLLYFEVPAHPTLKKAPPVFFYGHLDKQPEFDGWRDGLGAWTPVLENERLYGRGGADDGYAVFASIAALKLLADSGQPFPRSIGLIECSEESGSIDLAAHLDALKTELDRPGLIVCLDAECGDYERLWYTTSLRGNLIGELRVQTLTEGVHSGAAGGIVPSTFQVIRAMLDRIENATTGEITLASLHVLVPPDRRREIVEAASVLGDLIWKRFPWAGCTQPRFTDPDDALQANTWFPALEITGADGLPSILAGGNVLRPTTALKLSLRLPPTLSPDAAVQALQTAFSGDASFRATTSFKIHTAIPGWNAPEIAPWLKSALKKSSTTHFGQPALAMGTGGSIPFMQMLADRYPATQYFVTGVLGPGANAHGPNEFLDLRTVIRLTACLGEIIASYVCAVS
ncbi:MAG: M20/M25/M40 family metallo-hydrolase [Gammaproteobacteria bacterium]